MDTIIKASQVKVGDFVRFSLRGYFFSNDPKWREHCERIFQVIEINPYDDGKLEFIFDDPNGACRGIEPETEVVLVLRPAEYVYSYTINPADPRDSFGGGHGTVTANSDDHAVQKIHQKHGQSPLITIDWVYAVDHKVSLSRKAGEK